LRSRERRPRFELSETLEAPHLRSHTHTHHTDNDHDHHHTHGHGSFVFYSCLSVAQGTSVSFTALTPAPLDGLVLDPGPFEPRGLFRRSGRWQGGFGGYCFKLGER
jgi:hypothetical protein